MSIAERTVQTTWTGSLTAGSGEFGQSSSGVLDGQGVTWGSRTVRPDGKTSPEELLAAAHSSCFAMALNVVLGERKIEPEQLQVTGTVTFAEVDGAPTITSSKIRVLARLSGLDDAAFAIVLEEAGALCPVSRLFTGAEITVEGELEG